MIAIRSTGLSAPDPDQDAVAHSVDAARACLDAAGLDVGDVDFLVNIGVYRHENLCEPSFCALIQHALEMSPDVRKYGGREVFSFDLNNGAAGIADALRVARAMLVSRDKERVLIVGADCPPSGKADPNFPITSIGAAMLVERRTGGRGENGLGPIVQRTSTEAFDGQRGGCDIDVHGPKSRSTIEVERAPDYVSRLGAFARTTAEAFLAEHAISTDGLRLICSEPSAGFAAQLGEGLGLAAEGVTSTYARYADVHTSGVTAGLHHAELAGGERALLVAAGGGLTVGCALYEAPSSD